MKRAMCAFALLTVACSNAPTQPGAVTVTSNAPALAGQWRGLFEITACTGQGGDCVGRTISEFMLTLAPSPAGLEGVLVLLDNERTTVNVSAAQAADGSLQFSAAGFEPAASVPLFTQVSSISLRADGAVGLTGSMTYTNRTFRTFSRTVEFRSAVRQSSEQRPGHFHGEWQGYYRTLSCSGECQVGGGGYNFPTGGQLTLTLSEAGGQVIGSLMSQSVTGVTQSGAIMLTGPALTSDNCQTCWDCEGVCQTGVRAVSARVDKLGRMTGTFEFSRKGWTGNTHFRQVMQAEMIGVTRRW